MPALNYANPDGLTDVEVRVLDYLARTLRPGYSPSREELSQAAGLGGRGYRINKILATLSAKQYVQVEPGRSRAVSLLRTANGRRYSYETTWIPLAGQLAPGKPLPSTGKSDAALASEAIELTRTLTRGHKNVYALQVKGNSMVDALVNDGDTIVVSATKDVRNGDMVVARVAGSDGQEATTLKYYYREKGRVRLQPAVPDMPPSYYHPSSVVIQGKVILVIRQMS